MYTVKEVADIVGIAPSTVRQWGKELQTVLSEGANPRPGMDRRYVEEDAVILHTAKVLRLEKQDWGDIITAVKSGERIMPAPRPEEERAADEGGAERQGQLVSAEWWERMTKPFVEHVATLENELAKAQDQFNEERAARLDAEKRATAAETRAEMLQDLMDQKSATAGDGGDERRPWWRRLFGGSDHE